MVAMVMYYIIIIIIYLCTVCSVTESGLGKFIHNYIVTSSGHNTHNILTYIQNHNTDIMDETHFTYTYSVTSYNVYKIVTTM